MNASPFREVALALLDAEEKPNQAHAIRQSFIRNDVNPKFLLDLVAVTIGVLAFKANETPRTVYETLFMTCPSDNDWRTMLEEWMYDPEEE